MRKAGKAMMTTPFGQRSRCVCMYTRIATHDSSVKEEGCPALIQKRQITSCAGPSGMTGVTLVRTATEAEMTHAAH